MGTGLVMLDDIGFWRPLRTLPVSQDGGDVGGIASLGGKDRARDEKVHLIDA